MKAVHLIEHSCAPQECDCEPTCHVWAAEVQGSSKVADVTCKNCLAILRGRERRKAAERRKTDRALEAWADECGYCA